jgi:hypothetical protein
MLFILAGAAVLLTMTMFLSKSSMLGFPCLIFWAIFSGYCYQQSTTTWDIYYLTFFGSMGMAIFSAFAAFALRTKKEEAEEGDQFFDEGGDDDVKFIDESGSGEPDNEDKPRRSARSIRERAERRRKRWD